MREVIFDHGTSTLELSNGELFETKFDPESGTMRGRAAILDILEYDTKCGNQSKLLFGGTITRWFHDTLPTLCYYDTPMGKWWSTDTRVCTPEEILWT